MESYQNATGEKEVEKWKEKDWVWTEVDERKGMGVEAAGGLDKQGATELKTPGVRESDARADNYETTEEPAHSDGPGNSCGLAVAGVIRNPIFLPIRNASE